MNAVFRISESLSLNGNNPFLAVFVGLMIVMATGMGSAARAATIIVNTTSDGFLIILTGQPLPCTLRDAITAANTNVAVGGCVKGDPSPTVDTILFNVGTGTPSIKPMTMLPVITEPIIIRGDSFGATRIELNGSDASWRAALLGRRAHGLFLVTGESTIRNLVINRFNGNGIVLTTDTGGGSIENFTPPEITDPSIPVLPCLTCTGGGGGGGGFPPFLPPIGGADARNKIIGCLIGTDATGTVAQGNGSGIFTAGIVTTTDMHTIGGATAAEANVISGNHGHGIILGGRGQWVRGNSIGTDSNGTLSLGNQFDGINIAGGQFSSGQGAIGATTVSTDTQCGMVIDSNGVVINDRRECGNKIAFNNRNGISSGFNLYSFLSNPIFSNGQLGIDVDQFGQTPNSPTSSRNFPALTGSNLEIQLHPFAVGTRMTGSITNFSSQQVIIQIFHSSSCDPSGFGEGQTFRGTFTVPGNGTFNFFVPITGGVITATATTKLGTPKTSEFSACRQI